MQWLALEFDFITGRYTGDYYDITTIDWFVDSDLGDDANAGTAAAPWKTISKLQSTAGVVNGHRVMINGIFTENVTITKQLRIIGVGGGRNGKTIFERNGANYIRYNLNLFNSLVENIEFINYGTTNPITTTNQTGSILTIINYLNCVFNSAFVANNNTILVNQAVPHIVNSYFSIYQGSRIQPGNSGTNIIRIKISGNNNTIYNCFTTGAGTIEFIGNNNHIFYSSGTFLTTITGLNNSNNVTEGNYFSPANNDFNFPDTSPLYLTGTLDMVTGVPNNVGAGRLGEFRNADLFEFKVIGGAEFTNTEPDGDDIFRTNDIIDGYFESGIIDLNEIKRGVKIGIHNSYTESSGALTKLIQETDGLTVRQGLDCELIIGNTANEVITKKLANNWLLYEYGKPVTVTIVGLNTYGNADPLFDPTDFIFPAFRFFKIKFRFKNA
jgi:hypothetical protein